MQSPTVFICFPQTKQKTHPVPSKNRLTTLGLRRGQKKKTWVGVKPNKRGVPRGANPFKGAFPLTSPLKTPQEPIRNSSARQLIANSEALSLGSEEKKILRGDLILSCLALLPSWRGYPFFQHCDPIFGVVTSRPSPISRLSVCLCVPGGGQIKRAPHINTWTCQFPSMTWSERSINPAECRT